MLTFYVVLLLAAGEMTESHICDRFLDGCPALYPDIPKSYPETEEELDIYCKPAIEYLKCLVQFFSECTPGSSSSFFIRALIALEEVCTQDTLLHDAVVKNLKCLGKRANDKKELCGHLHSRDRLNQITKALSVEGIITSADNESLIYYQHGCIQDMSYYACQSVTIEKICGKDAMNTYIDIVQKIRPMVDVFGVCGESPDFLPALIRLHKVQEEEERDAVAFRKRK